MNAFPFYCVLNTLYEPLLIFFYVLSIDVVEYVSVLYVHTLPFVIAIRATAMFEACAVFYCSNTGLMISVPPRDTDICPLFYMSLCLFFLD